MWSTVFINVSVNNTRRFFCKECICHSAASRLEWFAVKRSTKSQPFLICRQVKTTHLHAHTACLWKKCCIVTRNRKIRPDVGTLAKSFYRQQIGANHGEEGYKKIREEDQSRGSSVSIIHNDDRGSSGYLPVSRMKTKASPTVPFCGIKWRCPC